MGVELYNTKDPDVQAAGAFTTSLLDINLSSFMLPGKKKLMVKTSSEISATGGSAYQIYYRQKGTSKWKSTTSSAQSKIIKKLKKGKKYYVKVRAYKKVNGKTYYGAWSSTKLSKKIK